MPKSKTTSADIPISELIAEADRREARKDCVFFIEHYLKTFDPRPEAYPHHLNFILYDYQKDYVAGLVEAIRSGYDIFDEKSRDMGASWLALAVRFWMWLYDDGYQSLLGSRKEEYVDSGTYKSLFGKLEYYIRNIKDPLILPEGFNIKKHRTYMKLVNPANGNVIEGESSNSNFSRAGRYKDILFDELGFWPDAESSWTAAGDATRCRHAVTTPPDEPSYSKALRFSGRAKVRTWHWRLHPHKDDAWYAYETSRRTEEEILHELDISWEYSSTGRPYPEIAKVLYRPLQRNTSYPLYVSLDLGLDALAMAYYQPIINTPWIGVLEAFEASDHIIEWYFPFFGLYDCVNVPECPWCGKEHNAEYNDAELDFIRKVKDFGPAVFFGDPSGNSRHIESGVSPYSILAEHGIDVQVNDLENDWVARRDATKRILPRIVLNDTPGVKWMAECIKDAHYPKRKENSQAVTPINKPVHDWTSHHRTGLEFFSVNYKGEYDASTQVITPNLPGHQPTSTPYQGGQGGVVIGKRIDIGGILSEVNGAGRDWRNS